MRLVRLLPCLAALAVVAAPVVTAQETEEQERSLDVHFVPTPMPVVEAMLEAAQVDKNDVVYDLGSGDGRTVIAAAKLHGAKAIGIDLDPVRIEESLHNADTAGVADEVQFIEGDLFEQDLSDATVVTLYLLSTLNERLRPKLFEELRPGSRVVSHAFDMGDWEPDSAFQVDEAYGNNVYLWIIPADVEGEWTLQLPAASAAEERTLQLRQQYQKVEASDPVEKIRLRGDSITITLPGEDGETMQLKGRVTGDEMKGTVNGQEWRARRE